MKKMGLLLLIGLAAGSLTACARHHLELAEYFVSPRDPFVLKQDAVVHVESIVFREKLDLNIVSNSEGKNRLKLDLSGVRNDELARETREIFREAFCQRLREKGVEVVKLRTDEPYPNRQLLEVKIDMAHCCYFIKQVAGIKQVSESRSLRIRMSVFVRDGLSSRPLYENAIFTPTVIDIRPRGVTRLLAQRLADGLVQRIRILGKGSQEQRINKCCEGQAAAFNKDVITDQE